MLAVSPRTVEVQTVPGAQRKGSWHLLRHQEDTGASQRALLLVPAGSHRARLSTGEALSRGENAVQCDPRSVYTLSAARFPWILKQNFQSPRDGNQDLPQEAQTFSTPHPVTALALRPTASRVLCTSPNHSPCPETHCIACTLLVPPTLFFTAAQGNKAAQHLDES